MNNRIIWLSSLLQLLDSSRQSTHYIIEMGFSWSYFRRDSPRCLSFIFEIKLENKIKILKFFLYSISGYKEETILNENQPQVSWIELNSRTYSLS